MFDIKENLKKLPDKPGVYMHKDKLGQIIYVGKAISLRNRVRQYFQSSANSNPKVKAMVSHIAEFEYITCQTEMEALILECNLIKKYMPKYNVLLRDDKTYPYIMVTVTEEFPRIIKTRTIKKDGNRYFGPYSDVGAVNQIVDLLSKIYALKKCSLKEFPYNHRPCLNYHINQCKGICTGKVSRQEYMDSIEKIIHFLSGKDKPILNYLEEKMSEASENLEFEEAAKYRDYILAVKAISVTQRVTMTNDKDLDIVLPVKDSQNSFVVLFSVRQGKLSGRETFQIQTTESDNRQEMVYEFIKQYYSQWAMVPPEILIEKELPEKEILEDFLSSEGRKVKILVPQKGDKKALLSLAQSDTLEMLKTLSEKAKNNNEKKLTIIQLIKNVIIHAGFEPRILDEDSQGYRVESYDISNTNGVDTVGAMVVFEGIKPIRKGYRRFKIKTVEGQNDYGSLQEVLLRRFKRAKSGDDSFNILPDIILIDGGIGQVTAAYKVLDSLGIDLPVVGMAKDDSHRTRALVFEDGSEVLLKDKPILFKYAGTVQEEVHRFAIEYHRTLRNKNTINSILENIEGVGPTRRNALLNHFKTIEAIKKATVAELCNVPTITESIAINIKEYFS
ncbi:MAG: excinuclease ABC subunit UvrC [Eubacteriales bacterium]|nr:excinuclease ABC subunit UvrC [Eubacteriales bacterium]